MNTSFRCLTNFFLLSNSVTVLSVFSVISLIANFSTSPNIDFSKLQSILAATISATLLPIVGRGREKYLTASISGSAYKL